jgi:hypothetical protein
MRAHIFIRLDSHLLHLLFAFFVPVPNDWLCSNAISQETNQRQLSISDSSVQNDGDIPEKDLEPFLGQSKKHSTRRIAIQESIQQIKETHNTENDRQRETRRFPQEDWRFRALFAIHSDFVWLGIATFLPVEQSLLCHHRLAVCRSLTSHCKGNRLSMRELVI